jgi:hypothetical protein
MPTNFDPNYKRQSQDEDKSSKATKPSNTEGWSLQITVKTLDSLTSLREIIRVYKTLWDCSVQLMMLDKEASLCFQASDAHM